MSKTHCLARMSLSWSLLLARGGSFGAFIYIHILIFVSVPTYKSLDSSAPGPAGEGTRGPQPAHLLPTFQPRGRFVDNVQGFHLAGGIRKRTSTPSSRAGTSSPYRRNKAPSSSSPALHPTLSSFFSFFWSLFVPSLLLFPSVWRTCMCGLWAPALTPWVKSPAPSTRPGLLEARRPQL